MRAEYSEARREKITANDEHRDQGVLYSRNIIQFHGTGADDIPVAPTRILPSSLCQFSQNRYLESLCEYLLYRNTNTKFYESEKKNTGKRQLAIVVLDGMVVME
jgi:hypothetical protein